MATSKTNTAETINSRRIVNVLSKNHRNFPVDKLITEYKKEVKNKKINSF